jgi:hypothetical protein
MVAAGTAASSRQGDSIDAPAARNPTEYGKRGTNPRTPRRISVGGVLPGL